MDSMVNIHNLLTALFCVGTTPKID